MSHSRSIHPPIVRITHWINAVAIVVMILSGLAIHNAHPTLPFPVPDWLTIGGFISGLRWHFAAMWVVALNGLVMIGYGLISGRYARKLLPIRPRDLLADLSAALAGRLGHEDLSTYNAVQRLLYAGVLCAMVLVVVSGLAIWKPVQFAPITMLLGDFDTARLIHFLAMSAIAVFLVVHVVMAVLVPRTILAMLRGV
jgi:thiosulfate reductase cytochrome b subunit